MKNPPLTILSALLIITPGFCFADLLINAGRSSGGTVANVQAGQGPNGANPDYQAFNGGTHENANTGNLQTYTGTDFSEAGIIGTFTVGVEFTWPDTTDVRVRQAFGRAEVVNELNFSETWMGADTRPANGGNGTMANTTTRLNLTGLPANTAFALTSYHYDSNNQTGPFTTSLTGATTFDIGSDGDNTVDDGLPGPTGFGYSFLLNSNGSGDAFIDYQMVEDANIVNSFFVINGFDLQAIPEPSSASLALFGLGLIAFVSRRRLT